MGLLLVFQRFLLLLIACAFLFAPPSYADESIDSALFAGGCFWCLEHDLESLPGVISADSGYSGGEMENPTYQNHIGHKESVLVKYNSKKISYDDLLKSFWRNIDPYDSAGQFCDRGDSYKAVIFYKDEYQKNLANESLESAAKELSVPLNNIKVSVKPKGLFWQAEDYHQDFAKKNSFKYNFYRYSCQRDKRLEEVWNKNAGKNSNWAENS